MPENILKVPVARPLFDDEEVRFASDAVRAGEISGNFGKYISQFENDFAKYCGVQYGITTTNGTTALHLALVALGIGSGDEVLVQTFTNMATVFAVRYVGARPVAIDIEPDTWNLDPNLLESKITPKTKAIMVVHIYGHSVDMDPVMEVAKKHKLFVIEDCAEAHGAEYKGKRVGSFGDISCFSFYANKIITTGEGGMVVTDNKELADRARSLHSLSYGRGPNKFMHEEVGYNYRMSNVIAAIGCAQLAKIERIITMKRDLASFYNHELAGLVALQLPVEKSYAKNVYWMYLVVLRGAWQGRRKEMMDALKERGVETREAFVPYNQQDIFIRDGLVKSDECPVANYVGENGFYLPSGPVISGEEKDHVVSSLREVLGMAK